MKTYTVCATYSRELIMRIDADSDYEARYLVSRITGRSMAFLTTDVKPVEWEG